MMVAGQREPVAVLTGALAFAHRDDAEDQAATIDGRPQNTRQTRAVTNAAIAYAVGAERLALTVRVIRVVARTAGGIPAVAGCG